MISDSFVLEKSANMLKPHLLINCWIAHIIHEHFEWREVRVVAVWTDGILLNYLFLTTIDQVWFFFIFKPQETTKKLAILQTVNFCVYKHTTVNQSQCWNFDKKLIFQEIRINVIYHLIEQQEFYLLLYHSFIKRFKDKQQWWINVLHSRLKLIVFSPVSDTICGC